MNSPRKYFPQAGRNRSGLSFVEFVGCILALGSGVAIGSVYLGVDMKTLMVGILERAELVDPGFFGVKARASQIAIAPPAARADQSAALPADDAAPDSDQTAKVASIAPAVEDAAEPTAETAEFNSTPTQQNQAATHAYWIALTACIDKEVAHRRSFSGDPDNWQLFDYLTIRRDGHQRAVETLEQLDMQDVDDRLVWHGRQVLSWHQAGAKLYGRAADLLTDAPTDQLTGPMAQSWQSSATQHRMEEKLVREKHISVASYLDHAYKDHVPFQPAF